MQIVGYDWDSGNWPKCVKHGVRRSEIEALFLQEFMVLPARKRTDGEVRYIAIGESDEGRDILVVFTLRSAQNPGQHLVRPISARFMHEKERRHLEEEIARAQNR